MNAATNFEWENLKGETECLGSKVDGEGIVLPDVVYSIMPSLDAAASMLQ